MTAKVENLRDWKIAPTVSGVRLKRFMMGQGSHFIPLLFSERSTTVIEKGRGQRDIHGMSSVAEALASSSRR